MPNSSFSSHLSENVQCSSSVAGSRVLVSVLKRRQPSAASSIKEVDAPSYIKSDSPNHSHVGHPEIRSNIEDPNWGRGGKKATGRGNSRGRIGCVALARPLARPSAPRTFSASSRGRARGQEQQGPGNAGKDLEEAPGLSYTTTEILRSSRKMDWPEETTGSARPKEERNSFVDSVRKETGANHGPDNPSKVPRTSSYIRGPMLSTEHDRDSVSLRIDERSTTPLSVHGDSSRNSLFNDSADLSHESLQLQNNESSSSYVPSILKLRLTEKIGADSSNSPTAKDNGCKPPKCSEYSLHESLPPLTAIDPQFHNDNGNRNPSATYVYSHSSVIQFGGSSGSKQELLHSAEPDSQWASPTTTQPFSKTLSPETCSGRKTVCNFNHDYSIGEQFAQHGHLSSNFLSHEPKSLLHSNSPNPENVSQMLSECTDQQPGQYGVCSAQQNLPEITISTEPQFSSKTGQQYSDFQGNVESSCSGVQKYSSEPALSSRSQSHISSNPHYHGSVFLPSDNGKIVNHQTCSSQQISQTVTSGYISESASIPEEQESPLVNFTQLMYSE